MNLQVEFKEETGQSAYDLVNIKYKDYYVEWLEEQIEQLRIGGVSQQRELFVAMFDKMTDDDIQECTNGFAERVFDRLSN